MKQFIAIVFFVIAIFILASVDKRKKISTAKLLRNGVALSLVLCAVTLIVWLVSLMYFEWRLDFPAGQNRYCEIGFFVGTMEIGVTRYYGHPVIIKHYQESDPHAPNAARDYSPPKRMEFYSQWIALPVGYPRLFKWFHVEQDDWPDEYQFRYIEIPYWFTTLLFAIAPVSWWIRQRMKHSS